MKPVGRPRIPDEHLRLVADAVRDNLANAPRTVMERFGVGSPTAYKWLNRARERGFTTWTPMHQHGRKSEGAEKREYTLLTEALLDEVAHVANACIDTRVRLAVAQHFDISPDKAKYWLRKAVESGRIENGKWRNDDRICRRCNRPWTQHRKIQETHNLVPHQRLDDGRVVTAYDVCIQVLRDEIDELRHQQAGRSN